MTKIGGALYARLSSLERIAVTLKALARDDRADVERLFGTCPRFTCTMPDEVFLAGIEDAHLLGLVAYTIITADLGRLAVIEAVEPMLRLSSASTKMAFEVGYLAGLGIGEADDSVADDFPDYPQWLNSSARLHTAMEALRATMAATVAATYAAFDRATQDHYGVDLLTAVGAANPSAAAKLSAELEPLLTTAPNAGRLADMTKLLADILPPVGGAA